MSPLKHRLKRKAIESKKEAVGEALDSINDRKSPRTRTGSDMRYQANAHTE